MLIGNTAALLAKFKPAGAEKPVIRPYTPTNDEGKLSHSDFYMDFTLIINLRATR